jgi:putative DNA primase/helicase
MKFHTTQCNYANSKAVKGTDGICEEYEESLSKALVLFTEDGETLSHVKLTEELLANSDTSLKTFRDTGDIIRYDPPAGIWRLDGEQKAREYITQRLSRIPDLSEQLTKHMANEVIYRIQCLTSLDRSEFQPPKDKIPLLNGVLNLENGELEPHSSENRFLWRIPVTFNAHADCPAIDGFLEEVLGSLKQLFYEIAGYCPRPGNKYQRSFLAVGFGDNGKSTALGLLKEFLGSENVSARSLQELIENRFAKSDLYGKLANIHADIPDAALTRTGAFKMLTGGDLISAEEKFKPAYEFVCDAKLIFSCNVVPESYDDSDAFHRRWILIPFTKTIPLDRQDKNLLDKLTTPQELSGLFNKALAAFRRVEESGTFTNEGSIEAKRDLYQRLSDPIQSFIDDCVDFDPDRHVVKQELFQAFQEYSRKQRYAKVYSQKTFFRKFRDKSGANYLTDSQTRIEGGGTVRIFRGATLRDLEEDHVAPLAGFSHFKSTEESVEIKYTEPANPATNQTTISSEKPATPPKEGLRS